jgi:hypothetical protein
MTLYKKSSLIKFKPHPCRVFRRDPIEFYSFKTSSVNEGNLRVSLFEELVLKKILYLQEFFHPLISRVRPSIYRDLYRHSGIFINVTIHYFIGQFLFMRSCIYDKIPLNISSHVSTFYQLRNLLKPIYFPCHLF